MTESMFLIKIQLLLNSQSRNYLESKERLFLHTTLEKVSNNIHLSYNESQKLNEIFLKYKKYLNSK